MSVNNVLVTGASGFIGSRLVKSLLDSGKYRVVCMSRNPESIQNRLVGNVTIIKGDITNYDDVLKALSGIDIAFYLVHSMEGSTKGWAKFAEKDRLGARNFAQAATESGLKRIIYLGGLSNEEEDSLSEHMRSRKEVGDILKSSKAKVTIFRAAIILGEGSKSFLMLQYLVENLPLMVCPRWILRKTQPISVEDVVKYLVLAIEEPKTEDRSFDIGGPDILTFEKMMREYGKIIGRPIRIIKIPFLSLRLSSYWIDLVTPVTASIARPLIDSLKHDSIVFDNSIKKIIPFKLKSFKESVADYHEKYPKKITSSRYRSILLTTFPLFTLLIITSFLANSLIDISFSLQLFFIIIYILISLLTIYFINISTRLGPLISGTLGWSILLISSYAIMDTLLNDQVFQNESNLSINLILLLLSTIVIILSHQLFYESKN